MTTDTTGRRRYTVHLRNGPGLNAWADTAEQAIAALGLYGEERSIASITTEGVTVWPTSMLGAAAIAPDGLANVAPLTDHDAHELYALLEGLSLDDEPCAACYPPEPEAPIGFVRLPAGTMPDDIAAMTEAELRAAWGDR